MKLDATASASISAASKLNVALYDVSPVSGTAFVNVQVLLTDFEAFIFESTICA